MVQPGAVERRKIKRRTQAPSGSRHGLRPEFAGGDGGGVATPPVVVVVDGVGVGGVAAFEFGAGAAHDQPGGNPPTIQGTTSAATATPTTATTTATTTTTTTTNKQSNKHNTETAPPLPSKKKETGRVSPRVSLSACLFEKKSGA